MIQKGTNLFVLDNTGAQIVKCLNLFKVKYGYIGYKIVVVVKKCLIGKRVRKSLICKSLIVQRSVFNKYFGGINIGYMFNYVIILKKDELIPFGTRILGTVSFLLRSFGYLKILSLARRVI